MTTHIICFCREISKIFSGYPLLSRPMIPAYDIVSLSKKTREENHQFVICRICLDSDEYDECF